MTKTIGVIGVGRIGSRHASNVRKLGHKVITYDPQSGDGDHSADVIDESDAIIVASPTDTHAQYIEAAKASGTSAFVEKPIAQDLTIVGHTDRVVMVGYHLRFHSCVLKAKEWIDSGIIGHPLWANFVCAEKSKSKDNIILNWSHEIDLALHLLGPCNTHACVATERMADIIVSHFKVIGCQSTIHIDYVTEPDVRQSIIVGDKGTIILDLHNRYAWLRNTKGTIIDSFQGQDSWDSNYVDEIESFLARTDGQQTVGATADEAIEVLKVCYEAIRIAA